MFGGYVFSLSSFFTSLVSSFFRYLFVSDKMTGDSTQHQVIEFDILDDYPRREITSQEVEIRTVDVPGRKNNGPNSTDGTSWMKASNIVDYVWEERFYTGQLLAVHRDGNYIAYGIKGKSRSQCHIRVMNCSTGRRALIRESENAVEDLALAYTLSSASLLLAAVDTAGSLFVHSITENDEEIVCSLILHVISDENPAMGAYKVFWCPYIVTEDAEFEECVADLLAVTRSTSIEVWHVGIVTADQKRRSIKRSEGLSNVVTKGFVSIDAHSSQITEAVFSPDGTAIATASRDGTCKFYQVYMVSEEDGSRCLHEWRPHNGAPVTLLAFLDDHKTYSSDIQFWKYAVTGANENCELRLWSCETWQCLQAVTFSSISRGCGRLKIALDLSANFMVANCVDNKMMYVMELERTSADIPYISAVTELRLSYSILSFGVVSANHLCGPSPVVKTSGSLIELDPPTEESVSIKMFIVHPKSLQSCDVVYPVRKRMGNIPDVGGDNFALTNGDNKSSPGQPSPRCSPPSPVLLTPAAFSSPPAAVQAASVATSTATRPPTPPSVPVGGLISGNSSPSREVQQILRGSPEPTDIATIPTPEPPASVTASHPTASSNLVISPIPHKALTIERRSEVNQPSVSHLEAEVAMMRNDLTALLSLLKEQSIEIQELRAAAAVTRTAESELLVSAVDRAVTTAVTDLFPLAIDRAVETHLPSISRSLISSLLAPAIKEMKEGFAADMNRHLVASDTKLRDAINKLVRCSPMVKQVGASIVEVGKPAMEQIVKESISEALPKVDKACQNLFLQLSTSFSSGTAEYVAQVESQVERSIKQCQNDRTALVDAVHKFEEATHHFFESSIPKLESCVTEAIARSGGPQSRAMTPAVKVSDKVVVRDRIVAAASQGNFNVAFQEALSAGDLSLVTMLCEKVPVERVFTGDQCQLHQPILLSLVQQLSADMSSHTAARHKYLEEAVVNLDASHGVTREHIPSVLGVLVKQLEGYLATHTGPLCTRVNVLLMATQVVLSRTTSPNRFQ